MFYTYDQNNSGGSFDFDATAGITHHVIIEANSADEANEKAQIIGLYFDGYGDCSCCGNRWYEQTTWYDWGDEVPSLYGQPLKMSQDHPTEQFAIKWMGDDPEVFVHYADGRIVGVNS